jgi:hypothetical protein
LKRLKGQYLVVEEVILFGIGMMMIIGFIATFNLLNDKILAPIQEVEFTEINDYVYSNILKLNDSGVKNGYIEFSIPEQIGKNTYVIKGANRKLISYDSGEQYIEKYVGVEIEGIVSSTSKRMRVEYDGSVITLKGVSY